MKPLAKPLVLVFAIGASSAAYANVGVPLLSYPVMWTIMLLIPIIGAESYVLWKRLRSPVLRTCLVMTGANMLSTLAGIVIVIATFFVPVMAPNGTITDLATLLLLVPFFWLSVGIEAPFAAATLKRFDSDVVRKSVREANLYSYFLLAVFLVARIIKNWIIFGKFLAP